VRPTTLYIVNGVNLRENQKDKTLRNKYKCSLKHKVGEEKKKKIFVYIYIFYTKYFFFLYFLVHS